jgi:hypothetical protein
MIAVLAMFYEQSGRIGAGQAMLWMLSVVALLLALFSGGLLTADSISSEKREDTLGLLFLTNLKGFDVVAGKLSTHAITTASGLLATFPVFFLPILTGGVTWAETLRVLLAITVSFLFALSFGVWISARSRDARNAVMVTLTILLLVLVLPLLWLAILEEFLRVRRPSLVGIPQLSPGMLLYFARDAWYFAPGAKTVYWISIAIFLAASASFAALASRSLPAAWRWGETRSSLPPAGHPRFGLIRGRVKKRLPLISPYALRNWLLNRFTEFTWGKRFWRCITWASFGLVLSSFAAGDEPFALAIVIVLLMHVMTKFVFAFDATRALNEDKRSSALELLLVTPIGERAIASAQADAFRLKSKPYIRRLFLLTLAIEFTALANDQLHFRGDDFVLLTGFLGGAMIWTWSDYRTMPWLGMYHALKQSTHAKATLRLLAGILLVPWIPYFPVLFCMAESHVDEAAAGLLTLAWAVGGAIYQKLKTIRTQSRLIREFRMLASAP